MQGGRLALFRAPRWVVLVKKWSQVRAPLHRALPVLAKVWAACVPAHRALAVRLGKARVRAWAPEVALPVARA